MANTKSGIVMKIGGKGQRHLVAKETPRIFRQKFVLRSRMELGLTQKWEKFDLMKLGTALLL
jgi:hypothetical protein